MPKNRAVPFLISAVVFTVAVLGDDNLPRSKRQAPNINVHEIPKTSFSCDDRRVGEYYADPEANCQVYHVCIPGMHNKMSLMSFVCPNGTIFSQSTRVCTSYDRVDCSLTSKFYENVHGLANSKRTDYEADRDYDNYVAQPPPREAAPPARQSTSSRSRNTPAPPPPPRDVPPQPQRNTRFRSGTNQFRGQQAPAATTPAPVRTTAASPQVARVPIAPARPAPPAFRPPVLAGRPAQGGTLSNVLPPRPTVRSVVSTSTASYDYEYEYDYNYEDETPADGNARNKREAVAYNDDNMEEKIQKTGFTCQDKVAGGVYADIESDCKMFHICVPLGKYKMLDYKVFCTNGTGFDQETGSCREKEEFVCKNAHLFYQFEKLNQPTYSKKPVFSKKIYTKPKKAKRMSKE
ncbi:mucin-7-like [Stegodyphus dumicola]|uniref:mucin-7-like n=1 Tax=Stegodyphus dumicola TaxID=202533 RepID=UPI0015B09149|nr:mucin-7-like [Stegodyphus dumicola]XP_035215079.1 mucin-7-like [Stegodyphus dumicola]